MNFSDRSLANSLKDAACEIFLSTLDKVDGAKDLVLSQSILVQLDAVCGMQKLRQNAVDKVFKFETKPVVSETRNRVYVIRPTIEEVRQVAKHINAYLNQDDDKFDSQMGIKFWIIFAPKFVHYCDIILEEEGVYEYVSILECPLGLFPLEYDVYSLEDETIFTTLFLNKDITPLSVVVNSILQLQLLSGNIFDVHGQGNFAKIVADKLDQANLMSGIRPEGFLHTSTNNHVKDFENLRFTENKLSDTEPRPSFTDLYLIDRDSDYCSLLLSQSNYEGFLDESFGVCCNKLEFSTTIDDKATIKHSLASDMDPIYRDVRDNHFSTVFSLLKTRNQEMKEKYSRSQEMNLSNLKNFVAHELKNLQTEFKCLGIHISACEEIMRERNKYDFSDQLRNEQNILDGVEIRRCLDYISKLISHQLHPHVPLRLLALLSLTQGGLPPRDYKKYLSLYCETYGLQNNATFNNLKKLGLVTEMNLSLQAFTGGVLTYGSSSNNSISKPAASPAATTTIPSSLSLASFTGAMSSFTEKASGRMAAVVSSSVLPRRGNLSVMLKKFQLMPEINDTGYNIRNPKDPAFVYNGAYIPLICQLIDHCVLGPVTPAKRGASTINLSSSELMKLLPGPNFKRRQAFIGGIQPLPNISPNHKSTTSKNSNSSSNNNERSILIYFIGGVTFAEITALRFLAKQRNVKIAIATTSIVNGNKLMSSLNPKQHFAIHNQSSERLTGI
uniref:Vacuolar protein sorting-associated protein 33B n=1 Tax=Aceria tosichella TaxID=561515 RepID=A0A6G1S990_9ACAR